MLTDLESELIGTVDATRCLPDGTAKTPDIPSDRRGARPRIYPQRDRRHEALHGVTVYHNGGILTHVSITRARCRYLGKEKFTAFQSLCVYASGSVGFELQRLATASHAG